MSLFKLDKRNYSNELEALKALLKDNGEQQTENQRLLVELLEKTNKKQIRTEALCEDILATLSEEHPGIIPCKLFFSIMEYFELLMHYCSLSKDEALSGQVPFLEEKTERLLSESGIERICDTGIPADPSLHTIERTVEPPLPELDKTVAEILTSGYRVHGEVLKKAQITAYVKRI